MPELEEYAGENERKEDVENLQFERRRAPIY